MAKKPSHVHKLRKHKYPTGNWIFFCMLPDCHYKIDAALALGKKSLCYICGSEFIMTELSLKLHKPHCNDCGKYKVKGADGKGKFFRKFSGKVLGTEATTKISQELRSRLGNLDRVDVEDDI